MFEKIRKMKNQKGFTLVELIVVLVILAILAALLVPALTGYIDKANKEKVIATTRMVVMAAQTEVSEKYGLNADGELEGTGELEAEGAAPLSKTETTESTTDANADGIKINDIALLAEVAKEVNKQGTTTNVEFVNGVTKIEVYYNTKGQVTAAVVEQSGFTCTYKASPETGNDKYTVTDTRSK